MSSSDRVIITEAITGTANDKLKADHSLINTLKVEHASGLLEEAWGERLEEPGVWQGFITWEPKEGQPGTLEHNEHFKKAASQIFSQYDFCHVPFAPFADLVKSVTSPITEIIFTRIIDGADKTEFDAATQYALDITSVWEGCLSGSYGHRVENSAEVVMVLGWVNKEAHEKFVAGDTIKKAADRFFKVATIDKQFHVVHSNFLNSSGGN